MWQGRQLRPRCQPPLPDADLLEHPSLQHLVLDLAAHLEVRSHFINGNEMDWLLVELASSRRCLYYLNNNSELCKLYRLSTVSKSSLSRSLWLANLKLYYVIMFTLILELGFILHYLKLQKILSTGKCDQIPIKYSWLVIITLSRNWAYFKELSKLIMHYAIKYRYYVYNCHKIKSFDIEYVIDLKYNGFISLWYYCFFLDKQTVLSIKSIYLVEIIWFLFDQSIKWTFIIFN